MAFTRRIVVRGLIFKDGRLLAQRLTNNGGGFWSAPGGGVEETEPIIDALEREMIEETGVKPEIGRLIMVQQFAEPHKEKEYLELFFLITNVDDYQNIDLSATTHGLEEIMECLFIDHTEANLMPEVLQSAELIEALENQRPVIVYNELDLIRRSVTMQSDAAESVAS